jgi:hypothetical protein
MLDYFRLDWAVLGWMNGTVVHYLLDCSLCFPLLRVKVKQRTALIMLTTTMQTITPLVPKF